MHGTSVASPLWPRRGPHGFTLSIYTGRVSQCKHQNTVLSLLTESPFCEYTHSAMEVCNWNIHLNMHDVPQRTYVCSQCKCLFISSSRLGIYPNWYNISVSMVNSLYNYDVPSWLIHAHSPAIHNHRTHWEVSCGWSEGLNKVKERFCKFWGTMVWPGSEPDMNHFSGYSFLQISKHTV